MDEANAAYDFLTFENNKMHNILDIKKNVNTYTTYNMNIILLLAS